VEKLVYVVWRRAGATPAGFRAFVCGELAARLAAAGAERVGASLVDEAVQDKLAQRLTRLDPPIDGIVSFWLENSDDRAPCEAALAEGTSRAAGYLVVESVPLVDRVHAPAAGERVPGVNMVALLERPERIPWDEWIRIWHEDHKKVALETQSTFRYVRNVVVRPLTEDAPPWAGIVEEGFPAQAIGDPAVWYDAVGDPEKLKAQIARMVESCQRFLDLDKVESHPTSEFRLLPPA
jgi:hypothetical protein